MSSAAHSRLSRRLVLGGLASAYAGLAQAQPRIVTILGDSITAGLGLPRAQALPARLEAHLAAAGARATVRGAGVSGDTTAGGLARLNFSVQSDTTVCVVALGGNDLLRGVPAAEIRGNLQKIVDRLQARRIKVVLAGVKAPPSGGRDYAREVAQAFAAVGAARGVVGFLPDFLSGVAGVRALNQADGIHPNARGADLAARTLAPSVARALRA